MAAAPPTTTTRTSRTAGAASAPPAHAHPPAAWSCASTRRGRRRLGRRRRRRRCGSVALRLPRAPVARVRGRLALGAELCRHDACSQQPPPTPSLPRRTCRRRAQETWSRRRPPSINRLASPSACSARRCERSSSRWRSISRPSAVSAAVDRSHATCPAWQRRGLGGRQPPARARAGARAPCAARRARGALLRAGYRGAGSGTKDEEAAVPRAAARRARRTSRRRGPSVASVSAHCESHACCPPLLLWSLDACTPWSQAGIGSLWLRVALSRKAHAATATRRRGHRGLLVDCTDSQSLPRKIIHWKLKKVAGSSGGAFTRYGVSHNLTIYTKAFWEATEEGRFPSNTADSAPARAAAARSGGGGRGHHVRPCCLEHRLAERNLGREPVLELVTLREPSAWAVSSYYWFEAWRRRARGAAGGRPSVRARSERLQRGCRAPSSRGWAARRRRLRRAAIAARPPQGEGAAAAAAADPAATQREPAAVARLVVGAALRAADRPARRVGRAARPAARYDFGPADELPHLKDATDPGPAQLQRPRAAPAAARVAQREPGGAAEPARAPRVLPRYDKAVEVWGGGR